MFVISESQQNFLGEGKPLRMPGMLIPTLWKGGRKHSLLQPDLLNSVWITSSISEYPLVSLCLVLHVICTSLQSTILYATINLLFDQSRNQKNPSPIPSLHFLRVISEN